MDCVKNATNNFEAVISSMGRKRIINVPAKSKFKVGDKVKVGVILEKSKQQSVQKPKKSEAKKR